jgi:hypothetical protein
MSSHLNLHGARANFMQACGLLTKVKLVRGTPYPLAGVTYVVDGAS